MVLDISKIKHVNHTIYLFLQDNTDGWEEAQD